MFTRHLDSRLPGKELYPKTDTYNRDDETRVQNILPFDREARDGEAQFDAPMYVI